MVDEAPRPESSPQSPRRSSTATGFSFSFSLAAAIRDVGSELPLPPVGLENEVEVGLRSELERRDAGVSS